MKNKNLIRVSLKRLLQITISLTSAFVIMYASDDEQIVSDVSTDYIVNCSVSNINTATTSTTVLPVNTTTSTTATTSTSTELKLTTTVSETATNIVTTIQYKPTVTEIPTEPIQDETKENIQDSGNEDIYLGTYEATWYCAVDMGYTSQPYGSSGRYLESGYSIASNSIPSGSIVKIVGGGIDGTYRVDDCGGMPNNVIDFYYWDRSCIPNSFLNLGRINIEVYLIS